MAGKISEYSNTRTAFAGLDLFDVSATNDAGSTYESQKTTWTNLKAQLTSELTFLSSGDNVSLLVNDAGYVTSNITHTGEVTGLATLIAHPTMISNKTLVTAVATDMVLLWDATDSTLKRADVNDFLGGGGGNTIYSANDTISADRTIGTAGDANTLTFDVSTGNIGIGVSTAGISEKLHIVGNTKVAGNIIQSGGTFSTYEDNIRMGTGTFDALTAGAGIHCASGSAYIRLGDSGDANTIDLAMWVNGGTANIGTITTDDFLISVGNSIAGRIKTGIKQFRWGLNNNSSASAEVMEIGGTCAYRDNTSNPGGTAGTAKVYAKDVAGTTKLFTQDSAGVVTQLGT